MKKLCYQTREELGYQGYLLKDAPEKVLQFGEGNFLRAFVNYWFDVSNERAGWNGKCVLVQPIAPGLAKLINEQEGLYTLYLRGRENGERVDKKRIISSVSRCLNPYEREGFDAMMEVAVSDCLEYVVSNTTGRASSTTRLAIWTTPPPPPSPASSPRCSTGAGRRVRAGWSSCPASSSTTTAGSF